MVFISLFAGLVTVSAGAFEQAGPPWDFTIHSRYLDSDMDVRLSLPEQSEGLLHPVVVVLDAGWYFPVFAAFADAESGFGDIPSVIVAGVDCSDHFALYTPTSADIPDGTPVPESGNAEQYRLFLERELVPALEERFPAAPYTVLFGHSLAGLFTVYVMEQQGGVFEGFIASSPSLWWDDELMTARLRGFQGSGENLFISMGGEGPTMQEPMDRFLGVLEQVDGITHRYMGFPGSTHQQAPFKAMIYGTEYIFRSWAPPAEPDSLRQVTAHYDSLTTLYGYEIPPAEQLLNRLGYRLLSEGRVGEAVEAFTRNTLYHPFSGNVYDSLGEALLVYGDTTAAAANYRRSLELDPENTNARDILEEMGTL